MQRYLYILKRSPKKHIRKKPLSVKWRNISEVLRWKRNARRSKYKQRSRVFRLLEPLHMRNYPRSEGSTWPSRKLLMRRIGRGRFKRFRRSIHRE